MLLALFLVVFALFIFLRWFLTLNAETHPTLQFFPPKQLPQIQAYNYIPCCLISLWPSSFHLVFEWGTLLSLIYMQYLRILSGSQLGLLYPDLAVQYEFNEPQMDLRVTYWVRNGNLAGKKSETFRNKLQKHTHEGMEKMKKT